MKLDALDKRRKFEWQGAELDRKALCRVNRKPSVHDRNAARPDEKFRDYPKRGGQYLSLSLDVHRLQLGFGK